MPGGERAEKSSWDEMGLDDLGDRVLPLKKSPLWGKMGMRIGYQEEV